MAVALYMDVHIPKAITTGLRARSVDVLTAQEDNATHLSDEQLLDRCQVYRRVFVTFDKDLLREAAQRQKNSIVFAGVIYAHPLQITIRKCINDLELIAKNAQPEDIEGRIVFLPL